MYDPALEVKPKSVEILGDVRMIGAECIRQAVDDFCVGRKILNKQYKKLSERETAKRLDEFNDAVNFLFEGVNLEEFILRWDISYIMDAGYIRRKARAGEYEKYTERR